MYARVMFTAESVFGRAAHRWPGRGCGRARGTRATCGAATRRAGSRAGSLSWSPRTVPSRSAWRTRRCTAAIDWRGSVADEMGSAAGAGNSALDRAAGTRSVPRARCSGFFGLQTRDLPTKGIKALFIRIPLQPPAQVKCELCMVIATRMVVLSSASCPFRRAKSRASLL